MRSRAGSLEQATIWCASVMAMLIGAMSLSLAQGNPSTPPTTPLEAGGFPPNTIPGVGLPVYMSPDDANKFAQALDKMRRAAAAGDRAGYDAARKDWDAGIANLDDQARQSVDNTGRAQASTDAATLRRYQDNDRNFPGQPPAPSGGQANSTPPASPDTGTLQVLIRDAGANVSVDPLNSTATTGAASGLGNSYSGYSKDLPPGVYRVTITGQYESQIHYVRIKKGEKAVIDQASPGEVAAGIGTNTPHPDPGSYSAAAMTAIVHCDPSSYQKAKDDLEAAKDAAQKDVDDLNAIVNAEAARTGLPTNLDQVRQLEGKFKDVQQSGVALEPGKAQDLANFEDLLQQQASAKEWLSRVEAEQKNFPPPPQPDCTPPKAVQPPTPEPGAGHASVPGGLFTNPVPAGLPGQSGYILSVTPFGGYTALGNGLSNAGVGGGNVSFAAPLGQSFGVAANAGGGTFAGTGFFDVGASLYTRDPSMGLIGPSAGLAYSGSFGGVTVGWAALNGEAYLGRFTPYVSVGVAGANNAGNVSFAGNMGTYATVATGLAFYPIDDVALAVSFFDVADTKSVGVGAEYLLPDRPGNLDTAFFLNGFVSSDNSAGVLAGVKFSLGGGPRRQTLIVTHRTVAAVTAGMMMTTPIAVPVAIAVPMSHQLPVFAYKAAYNQMLNSRPPPMPPAPEP